MKYFPPKDPDEVLDYVIDWSDELTAVSDTITTSTWIVPLGITNDDETTTSTAATIWLSGGTDGTTYKLINRIVTAGDRTYESAIGVRVRSR